MPVLLTSFVNHRRFKMKKLGMIKSLLFAGFICAPLLGYASIPTEQIRASQLLISSQKSLEGKIAFFKLDPQSTQAVEETASLIKRGLEDLPASDIRGIFLLPSEGESETARVAFVDTAGECFIYDSVTRETAVCGKEEKVLVRSSQELLSSIYHAPNTSLSQIRALQVAGLGDWICSHREEIITGMAITGIITLGAVMTIAGGGGAVVLGGGAIALITSGAAIITLIEGDKAEAEATVLGGGAVVGGTVLGAGLGAGAKAVSLGRAALAGGGVLTVGIGATAVAMDYFCPARG